jgi:2-polyprenyl-6-methoxyphenol hydroxylase-like FAD-dependent oxidoreductase
MATIKNALIVGGGTAGLSAAIALRRSGVDAHVVEIKDAATALGSGVTIMGAMYRALERLGLADECAGRGAGCNEIGIYDSGGQLVQSVPVAQAAGPNYPGVGGIMRPLLQEMLLDAAKAESTPLYLGRSVSSLVERGDQVDVVFSDGKESSFNVVIGADGLHSIVRTLLLGEDVQPRFTGQAVWRAVVPRPRDYCELAMVFGRKGKAGVNAVSATQAYIFIAETIAGTPRPPREQWPHCVRELLAEFGGPMSAIREQITDASSIDYRALQTILVPAPWHRGRVILIGDVVHAPTPQLAMGAGLAVEDGVVLADLLRDSTSVSAAFEAFHRRRFERCKIVVENSVQLGEWEMHPEAPNQDSAGLSERSWRALAAPI